MTYVARGDININIWIYRNGFSDYKGPEKKKKKKKKIPCLCIEVWRWGWINFRWHMFALFNNHMDRNVRKRTVCDMRPTKTQISLLIRAVWSECSLSAWRNFTSVAIQNARPGKIQISLRECAGWSEYSPGETIRRYDSWRRGSIMFKWVSSYQLSGEWINVRFSI